MRSLPDTNTVSRKLHFWFEFGSTYSYLSAVRVESLAASHGVEVVWEPFLLGPIFSAQGWDDSPFNVYPAKGRYMWRDVERLCSAREIPYTKPSVFPRNGLLAARVALIGYGATWLPEFSKAVFRANFAEDRDISDAVVIREILASLELDENGIIAEAGTPENKAALREQTERAVSLGVFGAPLFTVGDELFWGDDRLEFALGSLR